MKSQKKAVNWYVFTPTLIVIGGAALMGLINNQLLTSVSETIFNWTLINFSWLYQLAGMLALILMVLFFVTKTGTIRLGGPYAKAKFPFMTWFAMTLTGGISTGLITYAVNEPMIYFGDIWGELAGTGLAPFTEDAMFYSMGRMFYHWSFVPYAMYSLSGLLIAYMYFNRGKEMTTSNTLVPLFGDRMTQGFWRGLIDTLCVVAVALGLAASLGAGLSLIGTGLEYNYGIIQSPAMWVILVLVITLLFTLTSVSGLSKGIKWLADQTAKLFYVLLAFVIVVGPLVYCLNLMNVGLGTWLDNFWTWGLDPGMKDGEALVTWWTMYAWSIWIAYAPMMGIFFALISYGRTIRQFLTVNFILPGMFGIIWIAFWGGTAMNWQVNNVVDIVGVISELGATSGLWAFVEQLPLAVIMAPLIMLLLICGFATTANTMATSISVVCSKGLTFEQEPSNWMKWLWGGLIGIIAGVMVCFGGGEQGVDGVKQLSAAGGFVVLFLFILQMFAAIKVFFFEQNKVKEVYLSRESQEQENGTDKSTEHQM